MPATPRGVDGRRGRSERRGELPSGQVVVVAGRARRRDRRHEGVERGRVRWSEGHVDGDGGRPVDGPTTVEPAGRVGGGPASRTDGPRTRRGPVAAATPAPTGTATVTTPAIGHDNAAAAARLRPCRIMVDSLA